MRRMTPARRILLLVAACVFLACTAVPAWRGAKIAYHLHTARYLLGQGELAQALSWLAYPLQEQPRSAEVHYLLGNTYRRQGNFDRALRHLAKARQYGWRREDVDLQVVLIDVQRGDVEAADPLLDRAAVHAVPDDVAVEIYEALAKGYLALHRIEDAMVVLDTWIQWQPRAVQPRLWRARIHERENDWDRAAAEYRQILSVKPDDVPALLGMAGALLARNEPVQALPYFRRCTELAPDPTQAQLGLAQCLRRLGRGAEAGQLIATLLRGSLTLEQQATAHYELGLLALADHRLHAAIRHLQTAVDLAPQHIALRDALAEALEKAGKSRQAASHRQQAERLREQEGRISRLLAALAESPHNPDLRCDAGDALMQGGYPREAVRWYMNALKIDPEHRRAHESLARYYEAIDMPDLAAEHRQHATQAGAQPQLSKPDQADGLRGDGPPTPKACAPVHDQPPLQKLEQRAGPP
jgi:tetratricopeptide (TPR) repeat protein